jgi:hypothetical protein
MSFLLLIFSPILSISKEVTPFGTALGQNGNTIGYSNGIDSYTSNVNSYLGATFTGMKWQCVEYARRWLITEKGITFDSVNGAADIWTLDSFSNVSDESKVSISTIENGSKCKPSVGSLLIYKRGGSDIPYGHVAVITFVYDKYVRVSEQNWENDYWPGNYSRELAFTIKDEKYYLIDVDYTIQGWVEYDRNITGCGSEDSYEIKKVSL